MKAIMLRDDKGEYSGIELVAQNKEEAEALKKLFWTAAENSPVVKCIGEQDGNKYIHLVWDPIHLVHFGLEKGPLDEAHSDYYTSLFSVLPQ